MWALIAMIGSLWGFALWAAPARDGPVAAPAMAVKAEDVDVAACRAWANGTPVKAEAPEVILGLLGLDEGRQGATWSAGEARDWKEATFQYVLAFKRPVEIGSVLLATSGPMKVSVLKPGAAVPAKFDAPEWTPATVLPHQSGGQTVTFDKGFKTQALLLTDIRSNDRSELRCVRFFAARLHNAVPGAVANAESEFTEYSDLGPPTIYGARNIVNGYGYWQNTGPNKQKRYTRAPISDLAPSWFTLAWDEPTTVCGLLIRENAQQYEIATYVGSAGLNPAVATEEEWKKVRQAREVHTPAGRLVWFEPVATTGLRIKFLRTDPPCEARIYALQVFTDLEGAPVPAIARSEDAPVFRIPLTLPGDGEVSLVVNDAGGRRVANVLARAEAKKGDLAASWDLKDLAGHNVPPGTYTWKALWHPPLALVYQMTPYPNIEMNAPENSPWLNGAAGPGGWLADHTPPIAVTGAGQSVYLSAPCAESGVALIETDLDGRKKWGHHNFADWTGPSYLAADAKAVYGAAPPNGSTGTEYIWRVDLETKEEKKILDAKSTTERRRGIVGLAARDGKVYAAIRAEDNWLMSAATDADVDLKACAPLYPPMRKSNDQREPDPRTDFLRLFRLTGTPPGYNGLIYLESTDFPESANHFVLAFAKPVPIGTLVFPFPDDAIRMEVSVLKEGAAWPPNAADESAWAPAWKGMTTERPKDRHWAAIPMPEKTLARALRITFRKGADAIDDVLNRVGAGDDDPLKRMDSTREKGDAKKGVWKVRLEGMKLLRRRFESLLPAATVRTSSGKVNEKGEWDAQRTKPLSAGAPGIYALEWPEAQKVRGLAIKEIDGKKTEIDVFEGEGPVDIAAGAKGWRKVAEYEQALRNYYDANQACNGSARYVDGYVDFGKEIATRAVRLRVVEQWSAKGEYPFGVRSDRGAQTLDLRRCRVYGVAPLKVLGGEAPADPLTTERLEVIDGATGKILKELPLAQGGRMAFGPAGELYMVSEKSVVKVDPEGGKHAAVITDLADPKAVAVDKAGAIYVYDNAPDRQVVRVYDAAGKYVRAVGTPGGPKNGAWDPTRLNNVSDIALDDSGQLWAVDWCMAPKRVTVWSAADGKFKKELLGNTLYGGGGVLDPYDKTHLFLAVGGDTMEFALDWEKGRSYLKNRWHFNSTAPEVPIRIKDKTYLVTRPMFAGAQAAVVYLLEGDKLRPVAAVGQANGFAPLNRPEIVDSLGGKALTEFQFIWADRNGDGVPQFDEVQLTPGVGLHVAWFDRTLGLQAGRRRYEVQSFLADGTPVYAAKENAAFPATAALRLSSGRTFFSGSGDYSRPPANEVWTDDGKLEWSWMTEGWGGHALGHAKPYTAAQVICEFDVVGAEKAHAGDLGEFFVTNSNVGTWNIWTSDGILAGRLFRDIRDPKRQGWSMREHPRGLRLEDATAGQEHFNGYFCKTADDHYYVVAGHNHASIVEVVGLDKYKRLEGRAEVTADDVKKTEAWEHQKEKRRSYEAARVVDCRPRGSTDLKIDGDDRDWPAAASAAIDLNPTNPAGAGDLTLRMMVDEKALYLCYAVRNHGPMKNTGNDWRTYFKTGASVDLQMGVDPKADPLRKDPVEGDWRLLFTVVNGEPQAVLYRPVAAGSPKEMAWQTGTMVWRTRFDRVERLKDVQMACQGGDGGWVFEAAVPLATIGLKPEPGQRYKMDWGVLESGKDGHEVLQRIYWSNKATGITADVAFEAMIHPDLWGFVRFVGQGDAPLLVDPEKRLKGEKGEKSIDDWLKE
jgi:hypothetical protein